MGSDTKQLEQLFARPTADEVAHALTYMKGIADAGQLARFTDDASSMVAHLSLDMRAGFENGLLIGLAIAHLRQQFVVPTNLFRSANERPVVREYMCTCVLGATGLPIAPGDIYCKRHQR